MSGPTFAGYIAFVRDFMRISSVLVPDNSIFLEASYQVALATVNKQLVKVCAPRSPYTSIYGLAVYNLAGDRLINFAPDLDAAPFVEGTNPPLRFFAWARKEWNVYAFTSGVVQSTADESTSVSMVVPEAMKNFTIADLQYLKTPWGRQYLQFAQDYGPSAWGIS